MQQFTRILKACPGLIHLAILRWGPTLYVPFPVERCRLHLSNLKKSPFSFLDMSYTIGLLSLFDFLLLEEFILENAGKVVSPLEVEDLTALLLWLASTLGAMSDISNTFYSSTDSTGIWWNWPEFRISDGIRRNWLEFAQIYYKRYNITFGNHLYKILTSFSKFFSYIFIN